MAGLGMFDTARQDVRFAFRSFLRTPGFTAVAVLTLAIGIGGTTAIFSAVNALLLRPLPFREPDRLMMVSLTTPAEPERPASDGMVWSYPKFVVFRDAQTSFQDLAVMTDYQATLTGGGEAERANIEFVGARYLPTLGIQPALGRNFLPEEDRNPGGPKVVLLSDALWQRRYNADPKVLGTVLDVGGEPFTIVGVLPPGFKGISGRSDIMVPVLSSPRTRSIRPGATASMSWRGSSRASRRPRPPRKRACWAPGWTPPIPIPRSRIATGAPPPSCSTRSGWTR